MICFFLAGEMAQQVKASCWPQFNSPTHIVEGETRSLQVIL